MKINYFNNQLSIYLFLLPYFQDKLIPIFYWTNSIVDIAALSKTSSTFSELSSKTYSNSKKNKRKFLKSKKSHNMGRNAFYGVNFGFTAQSYPFITSLSKVATEAIIKRAA